MLNQKARARTQQQLEDAELFGLGEEFEKLRGLTARHQLGSALTTWTLTSAEQTIPTVQG